MLRRLVTTLTVVMILGLLTIVGLLVIRVTASIPLALPDTIALPDGAEAAAFTRGRDWFAVVTTDDRILILDQSGAVTQTIAIGVSP